VVLVAGDAACPSPGEVADVLRPMLAAHEVRTAGRHDQVSVLALPEVVTVKRSFLTVLMLRVSVPEAPLVVELAYLHHPPARSGKYCPAHALCGAGGG
jgi:hypothetical protein